MPIYEYKCKDCGHNFETLVARAEPDTRPTCDKCGSTNVEKRYSLTAALKSAFSGSCGSGGFR